VRFQHAKLARYEAATQRLDVELKKVTKRSDVLTPLEESLILSRYRSQAATPSGTNYIMDWFCMKYYFITRRTKLRKINDQDFSLHMDPLDDFFGFS
jgi:hypothetical protein